jgi:hypothetical protein
MKPPAEKQYFTLPAKAALRVGQLVRMLGSDQPNEVAAAASALQRQLGAFGTDLHYLAQLVELHLQPKPPKKAKKKPPPRPAPAPPPPPPPRPAPPPRSSPGDEEIIIQFCASLDDFLTDRERAFVLDLDKQIRLTAFWMSGKQRAWLYSIHERLQGRHEFKPNGPETSA